MTPDEPKPQEEEIRPVSETPSTEEKPSESEPADPSPEQSQADNDEELRREMEAFDALIDQHLPGASEDASRGELVEVTVIDVREDYVLVDVDGKAEATIPLSEFTVVDGKPAVASGQKVPAVLLGTSPEGNLRLSHAEARRRAAEAIIHEAREKEQPVVGRIARVVKGGVMVDIGLDAFMPASQVDLFKIPDLNTMVGREVEAYVIEYDPRRKRAVLSRRRLLYEQREKERRQTIDALAVGQEITGRIKSALDFGVFLDLGVIDGFIPREEVSWDRGTHPSDLLKAGEMTTVKVVKIDADSGKITLSRKRMTPDPWETIDDRFPIGARVTGKVIALQSYGAFVHLEEGITGMIHASDLSWEPGNKKPADFVAIDQDIETVVLDISKDNKRLSLGLKQLQKDPWEEAAEKYKPGNRIQGTVTSMTNYGAFIRLDGFIEGMVHVSDLSWSQRINHPKEVLKPGEEVEVVVLKTDPKARRISLGIKQITESPFDAFAKANPQGSFVTAKVARFAPFGAFVEVAPGLEGLIHISQIDDKRVELPEHVLAVGEEVTCKVIKLDPKNHKISLSRKEALRKVERDTVKQYMKKSEPKKKTGGGGGSTQTAGTSGGGGGAFSSLGEALAKAREEAEKKEE